MKIYENKTYLTNEVINEWVEEAVEIYKNYFLPAFNGFLLQLLMLNSGLTLNMVEEEKLKA